MATKASGTLVLIVEKQHASWDLMCRTSPALELRFRRQPHIASAHPLARGPYLLRPHAPYWWFVCECMCRTDLEQKSPFQ